MDWWLQDLKPAELARSRELKDPLQNQDVSRFSELSRLLTNPDDGIKYNLKTELAHRSMITPQGVVVYDYHSDVDLSITTNTDDIITIMNTLPKVTLHRMCEAVVWVDDWIKFSFKKYRYALAHEQLSLRLHIGVFDKLAFIERQITPDKLQMLARIVLPKEPTRARVTKATRNAKTVEAIAFLRARYRRGKYKFSGKEIYAFYKCSVPPPAIPMKLFEPLISQVGIFTRSAEANVYCASLVVVTGLNPL